MVRPSCVLTVAHAPIRNLRCGLGGAQLARQRRMRLAIVLVLVALGCGSKIDSEEANGVADGATSTDTASNASDTTAIEDTSVAPNDAASPADTATTSDTTSSPDAGYLRCMAPGECELTPQVTSDCCAVSCGDLPMSQTVSLRRGARSDYHAIVCTTKGPCDACTSWPSPTLMPICTNGACGIVDVTTTDYSACNADSDCTLHYASCCQICSPTGHENEVLALAKTKTGSYGTNVCDPAAGACPPCVAQFPVGWTAVCSPTTKHCVVKK